MGNVTSAENDKVNELLTRRAKKKNASSKPHRSPSSSQDNSRPGSFFVHRQKSSASSSHTPTSVKSPRPLTDDFSKQADFYSHTGTDYSPLTPTSPITMYPSPSTTTSTPNSILDPYSLVMQPLEAPLEFQSEPVIIPQQPEEQRPSANPSRASSPSTPYLQQQQLGADLHLPGTSPEAKDWLKRKPTRSSGTHLIHQYNFHTHQYYQTPGSVKVVNNTCRNMSGYSNVSLPRINTTTTSNNNNVSNLTTRFHSASISSPSPAEVPPKPRPRSITAAAALMSAQQTQGDHLSKIGLKDKDETISSVVPVVPVPVVPVAPVPTEDTSKLPQPVSPRPVPDHFDSHFHGHGHGIDSIHPPIVSGHKKDRVGKLVMSLSNLNSPSVTSLASTVSSSSSRPSSPGSTPGSPMAASDGADTFHLEFSEANRLRPSSTLSSLRSLLGNHPQGLSLIESLEDEDGEAFDSLSDTETGDSDADLRHRTELLDGSVQPKKAKKPMRRPRPQFEWMDARKRFSSSSLSTIGIDVKDRYAKRSRNSKAQFRFVVRWYIHD